MTKDIAVKLYTKGCGSGLCKYCDWCVQNKELFKDGLDGSVDPSIVHNGMKEWLEENLTQEELLEALI